MDEIRRAHAAHVALEEQRKLQQGLGRPIISTEFQGQRVLAVGNRLYHSDKWKTFHDFLLGYPAHVLGMAWANNELKKPPASCHPLANWYRRVCEVQAQHKSNRSRNGVLLFDPLVA
jgi:hypothetical protein